MRWDFVFQRPQHLLTRCAAEYRVFYVEEPVFDTAAAPHLEMKTRENGVQVAVPHLKAGLTEEQIHAALKLLVDGMFRRERIRNFAAWYYTPMALPFTRHLCPLAVIYDCMDELSLFKGAHPQLLGLENELFSHADVVFTGGCSLYEHKRLLHSNIHAVPSSIDAPHFAKARLAATEEPEDQKRLSGVKIGFFGVIDERMNLEIIDGISAARPEWQLILLGPVVKVDPQTLPRRANIHYLGCKTYQELPAYIKSWNAAILPFALNDSTRFISPTKTPEYLAAGKPVVSTSIRDVISPYQEKNLVRIADTAEEFIAALEAQISLRAGARVKWLAQVDDFLASGSWDRTWGRMLGLIRAALPEKPEPLRRSATSAKTGREKSLAAGNS